jgi:ribosomal protein L11 methylase PrmA
MIPPQITLKKRLEIAMSILIVLGLLSLEAVHGFMPLPMGRMGTDLLAEGDAGASSLSGWVVENLEDDGHQITFSSSTSAGENDTLPEQGLAIADFRIFAAASSLVENDYLDSRIPICLFGGRNGWGTGVHPTTRLCLEWICEEVEGGEVVLDYGCGSGILSIAALHMGASRAIGVDVEAEALVAAERNVEINDFAGRFEGFHTREIVPYGLCRPAGVDICIANILVGQLVRSSMVSALSTNIAPNGLLCLSGIRPHEVDALKSAYGTNFEWIDDQYAEMSAIDCEGSIQSYGFDCGRWSRLVGRRRETNRDYDVMVMSESAVS